MESKLWEQGSACCFIGCGPEGLPWEPGERDPGCRVLRKRLLREVYAMASVGVARTFLTGLTMGTDLWCAKAALLLRDGCPSLGIRLVAVLPSEGQAKGWPGEYRRLHEAVRARADAEIVLSASGGPGSQGMQQRYLVDHAQYALGVYDGRAREAWEMVEYARSKRRVTILLDPSTLQDYAGELPGEDG